VYICMCMYIYICMYAHTFTHTHTHTHTHTQRHAQTQHSRHSSAYVSERQAQSFLHPLIVGLQASPPPPPPSFGSRPPVRGLPPTPGETDSEVYLPRCTSKEVLLYNTIHIIDICLYVFTYIYIYIYAYIRIHIHMHTYIYTYIYTFIY